MNERNLLYDNIRKLRSFLKEYVDRNDIVDAVENHDVIYIYYAGDNTVNRGYRTIEPFTIGVHGTSGNVVVRAWQQAGATDSRDKEPDPASAGKDFGWRLFRLDGITTLFKTQKKFKTRPEYRPNDKHMSTILAAASFTDEPESSVDGVGDITEPTSVFNVQADRMKIPYSISEPNADEDTFINSRYQIYKFYRKENPSSYIVVRTDDNKLQVTKATNRPKYQPNQILGRLDQLYNQLESKNRTEINRFTNQEKRKFLSNINKS
jgi:hypothetical protein